jgi:hypothetical protein|tara:strand:+ start:222 stop:404 length:183 start_codon:yes stop_codon:yes gene_type:complete
MSIFNKQLPSLHYKLMALHIATTTPVLPKLHSVGRCLLEATLCAALFGVLIVMLIIVGDA